MPAATGLQVAILIFAFQFVVLFAAGVAADSLPWLREAYVSQDQFTTFGLAAVALSAISPLRRYCIAEFKRLIPTDAGREIALVALASTAIPFALLGATVLGAFAAGEPGSLPSRLPSVDSAAEWERALSPAGLVKAVAIYWSLGPIVEELVFRGFLYRAWERQWGWIPSVFLTSACFGLIHPYNFIGSFLTSVVLICILRRTGTLRACILVHMAYNILVSWPLLGQVLLTIEGRDVNRMSTWSAELASLVFVAVALPAYLAMSRRDAREAVVR
jgi:membrane protease YdiL (CAAX protease family)